MYNSKHDRFFVGKHDRFLKSVMFCGFFINLLLSTWRVFVGLNMTDFKNLSCFCGLLLWGFRIRHVFITTLF
jgi:hypothetical protein